MLKFSTIRYKKFTFGNRNASAEKQIGKPRQKRITSLTVCQRRKAFKAVFPNGGDKAPWGAFRVF